MVATNQQLAADANDQDRLMALLAWIIGWIVSVIILVTDMRMRPFQRFHAVNALAFDIAWYIIWIALCLVCTLVSVVTAGIGSVASCLLVIPFIAWIVLKIWYAILAYQGNYFDIPFITDFCRQQRWI